MNRKWLAQGLTAACLAGALAVVALRRGEVPSNSSAAPEDTVYAMLDAARDGDAAGYLASYDGALAESLRRASSEQGEERFRQYLRSSNASIKGVAISPPEALNDNETRLRVEYVYQDRNEVQLVTLRRSGGTWKIVHLESAERVKTLIPYGTPVQ